MLAAVDRSASSSSGPSDEELADAIAAGDHGAFRTLMRRHNRLLFRTARSVLRDDADAEDVVQNAYLLAYRGIGGFRREARLSTWLVRIVINEALACLRKRSRSAHVVALGGAELDSAVESEADVTIRRPERPDESLMRSDTRRLIHAKIDELPLAYRAVFVLRAVKELSVSEAATALNIPEATVRTRFFRARALLRQALSPDVRRVLGTAFPCAGARCGGIVTRVARAISAQAGARAGRVVA
jgi:RNA polymerase sigma-70 factor (ECF subfamily)